MNKNNKMKNLITLTLSVLLFAACSSEPVKTITVNQVETTVDAAIAKAGENNQKVFVEVHATYCKSCKKFSKEVMSDKEVTNLLASNMATAIVDIESEEGQKIKEKYGVQSTPTFLILDEKGELLKKAGYMDKAAFLSWIN